MNEHLYVIGDVMAKEKAEENQKDGKASIPYNYQHQYWYARTQEVHLHFK